MTERRVEAQRERGHGESRSSDVRSWIQNRVFLCPGGWRLVVLPSSGRKAGDRTWQMLRVSSVPGSLWLQLSLGDIMWTVARPAPLSTGFSRQEYWSGQPFPSPGDLPDPRIEPGSPALRADTLSPEPPGKLLETSDGFQIPVLLWIS